VSLAPQPYLSACLRVLYRATIEARMMGYAGEQRGLSEIEGKRLADLMDAVHNLPDLIQRWDTCNEDLLRGMLRDFDARWYGVSGVRLLEEYEGALARGAV
jgi:hypothetical protein